MIVPLHAGEALCRWLKTWFSTFHPTAFSGVEGFETNLFSLSIIERNSRATACASKPIDCLRVAIFSAAFEPERPQEPMPQSQIGTAVRFDELIGVVYEAGALPELWPAALQQVAAEVGALGGTLIFSTSAGIEINASPAVEELAREFVRQGWNRENSRVSRLMSRADYPGFLADIDLHTIEEIQTLPMYREFLTPNRVDAGAATVVSGANDDGIIVAMEGFQSHQAAQQAATFLNRLRPHLARASVLSGRIQEARVGSLIEAFNTVDTAIAVLDHKGKLIASSVRFQTHMEGRLLDGPNRLRIFDLDADQKLASVLADQQIAIAGASIAIRDSGNLGVAVLHLIPARLDARDLFGRAAYFAVLSRPGNELLPSADILSAIFDLTPAEARVARAIGNGGAPSNYACENNLSLETVRSQLKRVFSKTSTNRQSELSLLISRLR